MPPKPGSVATKPAPIPAAKGAKPAAAAAPPAEATEGEGTTRVKLADLSPEERAAKCQELITELYSTEGTDETAQNSKRKLRSRLRTIDKEWRTTQAEFIQANWPDPVAEEAPAEAAPATPAKGAKPAAPAAKPAAAKPAPAKK